MPNIAECALRIFAGPGLEDKLQGLPLKTIDFRHSFDAASLPQEPARAERISFAPEAVGKTPASKLPSRAELGNERRRGELLHFFANHELLAIELMAHAILKWGAQDPEFCRDTYLIIRQEQQHFSLYRERMRDFGVEFGDCPLNDFFWRMMKSLDSREQFLAVMALTFEQANLDFAIHYRDKFQELGDVKSAKIMDRVYREEITHVAHGVHYLEKALPFRCEEQWASYLAVLPEHIKPTRAVGLGFDSAGRAKAGLSMDYIDRLSTYGQDFGKKGRLFVYNSSFELDFLKKNKEKESSAKGIIRNDLSFLMTYLAKPRDTVLVHQAPRLDYLKYLRELGLAPPFYRESPSASLEKLQKEGSYDSVVPWGEANDLKRRFSSKLFSLELGRKIWDALQVKGIPLVERGALGEAINDLESLKAFIKNGKFPLLLKAVYGASGRGNRVLWSAAHFKSNLEAWAAKQLASCGCIIVQPYFAKRIDLSMSFDFNAAKSDPYLGARRAFTKAQGTYIGHGLGRSFPLLPMGFERELILKDLGLDMKQQLRLIADEIISYLQREGYLGPLGVDLMLVWSEDTQSYRFFPLLELNCRWTMGRVALSVESLIASRHLGLFMIEKREAFRLNEIGLSITSLQTESGLICKSFANSTKRKVQKGMIFLNDPIISSSHLAVLLVADSLEALSQELAKRLGESRLDF